MFGDGCWPAEVRLEKEKAAQAEMRVQDAKEKDARKANASAVTWRKT